MVESAKTSPDMEFILHLMGHTPAGIANTVNRAFQTLEEEGSGVTGKTGTVNG